ncbi:MAG: thiamine phosphate synthase [Rhizobiaceae bacterium]
MDGSNNQSNEEINRCRLVLIASATTCTSEALCTALEGGDIASLVIMADEADPGTFADICKEWVAIAQQKEIAVLVASDTQVAGRSEADGIFVDSGGLEVLEDAIACFSPHKIVGCGGIKDRHRALEIGDRRPDFVFFGKLKGDIKPVPHRKNIALADWWSKLIETPCVIMGGNEIDSVIECAASGADFVALNKAVFEHADGPKAAVVLVNQLLEDHAPQFEEAEV